MRLPRWQALFEVFAWLHISFYAFASLVNFVDAVIRQVIIV
jgi:hypothetical protein